MELNKIYQGDSLQVLKTFPNESIDCIITSPPYYGLRDYGIEGQIGQEKTPQEYISNLMKIMDECKRVLKKTGSLWVNIGDTYPSGGGKAIECSFVRNSKNSKDNKFSPDFPPKSKLRSTMGKSLLGIPERFVIAMYDSMWLRRNTIIWYKPNCMPSSAKDRFTVDFEYLYFFTKQKKYYFETQYEDFSPLNIKRHGEKQYLSKKEKLTIELGIRGGYVKMGDWKPNPAGRMKRCVWKIQTKPFKGAHFAIFPEKLIETPIKACCPAKGVVLDCFMGAGTVGVVAKKLGVDYVGIELNKDYVTMANNRINSIL